MLWSAFSETINYIDIEFKLKKYYIFGQAYMAQIIQWHSIISINQSINQAFHVAFHEAFQ